MKKYLLIIALVVIAVTVIFFNSNKLLDIERNITGFAQEEIKKQVYLPDPLRNLVGENLSDLTIKGVIEITNKEREKYGLPSLKENSQLDLSAGIKAEDMFKNQYFEHTSPIGTTMSDLVKRVGYDYITVGENLAMGNFKDDEALVTAWMNSQGHRENILNPSYKEIGVSVIKGAFEGRTVWMAVQHFGMSASSCKEPDPSLKVQIEANQNKVKETSADLDILYRQIQSDKWGKNKQQVDEYNSLVVEYNVLVSQTKAMVERYNQEVQEFNKCASGN